MKQSTTFAQVATNLLNVLQGYTKGIRFVAVLTMLLIVGIGQAWGQYTKASSIAVGDVVVLVYESGKKELSSISGYGVGTSYNGTPAGLYELTVEAGSSSGTFSLKNGSTYLSWSSGNSLATTTSKNSNSSWKITFSSGNATILNAKDNSRKLQWNASSPRFACYTSNQTAVQLYKKVRRVTKVKKQPTVQDIKKRAKTIYVVSENKARDWDSTVGKMRIVQQTLRQIFAWNKPWNPITKVVVKIPDRFRNVL